MHLVTSPPLAPRVAVMSASLFAKRHQPARPRRIACQPLGSESDTEPESLAQRGYGSGNAAASGAVIAPATRRSRPLSLDLDDGDGFRVRKSKLSRQMTARRAPAVVDQAPRRAGVATTVRAQRVSSKDLRAAVPDVLNVSEVADIQLVDGPLCAGEDGLAERVFGGEEAIANGDSSDDEADVEAGMRARLARAQRAAARELSGNGTDAGPVAAEYLPLVPAPRKPSMEIGGSCGSNSLAGGAQAAKRAVVVADAAAWSTVCLPHNVRDSALETDGYAAENDAWELKQMQLGSHRRRRGAVPAPELLHGPSQPPLDRKGPLPSWPRDPAPGGGSTSQGTRPAPPAEAMAALLERLQRMEGGAGEREKRARELEEQRHAAEDQLKELSRREKGLEKSLRACQQLEDLAWSCGGLLDEKVPKLQQAGGMLGKIEKDFASRRRRRRMRSIKDTVMSAGARISKPDDEKSDSDAEDSRPFRRRAEAVPGWDTSSGSGDDVRKEWAKDRIAFCTAAQKQLLGDVGEDYATVAAVLRPLQTAKSVISDDYTAAFVPEALPEILAFHIGLSLLWWDPLKLCPDDAGPAPQKISASVHLEDFDWFNDLMSFTELRGEDDPDGELVPKLVQKCVFPDVVRRVADCWDVSSARQSSQVVAVLDECLLFETADDAAASGRLLEAVMVRLKEGLAELVPEVFVANDALDKWYCSAPRMRLLWRGCKIAHCAAMFDGRLPDELLAHLVLQDIFMTRLAPHLRAPRLDAKELAVVDRFVHALPERWLAAGLPPALAGLRDALGPRAPTGPQSALTLEAAARVLHRLRCYDEADVLLNAVRMLNGGVVHRA